MTTTPKLSITAEDGTLVVRLSMAAHPLLPKLWDGLQRSSGQPQLMRLAYSVLVQAVAQTIAESGPDMWAEARALNNEAVGEAPPTSFSARKNK